jgi:hypothetical protein
MELDLDRFRRPPQELQEWWRTEGGSHNRLQETYQEYDMLEPIPRVIRNTRK